MTPATLLDATLARRLERLTLVTRRRLAGQGQGDRRSLRKGASLEFADYRHYVHGDDPTRVDWNVYARTDALFVREYEEEEILNLHLVVDASRSMDWGDPNKLACARRLVASLGYVALSSANRLFVWPLNATVASFGPAWGRGRTGPLLAFLEALKPAQTETPLALPFARPVGPDLDLALASLGARRSGLTILVSDLLSPAWEHGIRRLAGRSGDVVVLHTLAPQELRPALGGDVRLVDRETGASVPLTLNTDALARYVQRLAEWQGDIQTTCQRYGVTYVPVDTAVPVETLLFHTLRHRGVVK